MGLTCGSIARMSEESRELPRILVVDDNESNRDLLSRRLEKKSFRVATASGGRRALDLLGQETFQLVLLDIMMPDMSGIEVLREIRKTRSASELPVIMATAKADSKDMVEALDLGANDYVTKPIDFAVLLARVQAQLRNRPVATATAPPRATPANPVAVPGMIEPGMMLSEKYRLESTLGSGGFGTVYRAHHLTLQRDVAIKVLHGSMNSKPHVLARFKREAVSSSRVKHPNAVMVLDFGVTPEGIAFLVMELLEGKPLSEVIRRDGKMDAARCASIAIPICDVLAEVHAANIVHRDLKPANVFLERLHGRELVKVVDFGIAKMFDPDTPEEEPLTMEGTLLGTPAYMAPERFRDAPCDGRADVYSLGVMMFEMLGGRKPFISESGGTLGLAMLHLNQPPPLVTSLAPDTPAEICALVAEALVKDPEARPTAAVLGRKLGEFLRSLGAPPPGTPSPE